ncbi:MAG TPA: ATP-binding protein, partial [Propionibacteriaceae bacterium]|nr:ATP-binding protein [Propionibacteriaceae bacterium]
AVAVRDHGVGFEASQAKQVFHRFWRADPARARTVGGSGLGLAIAMEDANLHGGWLTAWGRPGLGAQFRLTVARRLGMVLRTSPLPLVPRDLVPAIGTAVRPTTASASEPPTESDLREGPTVEGDATVPNPTDEAAVPR